jgi:adenosylcobinamide-GDP ribazoletransferase
MTRPDDGGVAPAAGSGPGGDPTPGGVPAPARLPSHAEHPSWAGAVTLAVSLFSVVPVRAGATDRGTARRALALAPLVGLLIGGAVGGVVLGLLALGAPGLLAGLLGVGVGAALTRGLHLDGLADLADGLGSYAGPERMLAVMKDPSTGAFAVVTLVLALGIQAAALPAVAGRGGLGVLAVALAWAAGRVSFSWCARRGVAAAAPGGLGALVAGTQHLAVPVGWTVVVAAAALLAVPGRLWQGPVAVLVAALVAVVLARHAVRRLGGVNGDVFGGVCEATVTAALAVLALG